MSPLGKWDVQAIRYLKRKGASLDGLKAIWAERCGMDVQYIKSMDLALRFLEIVDKYELVPLTMLVADVAPDRQWMYGYGGDPEDYWDAWLRRLCSLLANTNVADLPGYTDPDFIFTEEKR
jgi:hypothetical protein